MNIKKVSFVAKHSCLSLQFVKLSTVLAFSNSWLTQTSIVPLRRMLVTTEYTSKLPRENVASCSRIIAENWKKFLTAYSLIVEGFNMGAKNLAKWYGWVCKTNKFGRNERQSSLCYLCALGIPYIVAHLISC